METNTIEEFRSKFKVNELNVYNSGAWTWSIRPDQPTLGAGVISLNRFALNLSDVSADEMKELADLIKVLETTMKKTFNHNIMNYLMLMMVDHHVHYHVIPRYDGIRDFCGLEWVDNGWPALPVMSDSQHKSQENLLNEIKNTLISNI